MGVQQQLGLEVPAFGHKEASRPTRKLSGFREVCKRHSDVLATVAAGLAFALIFSNAGASHYRYDEQGRVLEVVYVGSKTITKRSYRYDDHGNPSTTLSSAPVDRAFEMTMGQTTSLAGQETGRARSL